MRCRCESFRPGSTVRPPRSITRVLGPRNRNTVASFPTSANLPSMVARAEARGLTGSIVAVAPLKTIRSASDWTLAGIFASTSPDLTGSRRWNDVLGARRRRRLVDHRVGILDAHAIGAEVGPDDVHHRIVGALVSPVALPFEHDRQCGHGTRPRLNDAFHRVIVGELADIAATILDDVDLVVVVDCLDGRQGHAGLGPKPCKHNLPSAGLLDGRDEVLVIP